MVPSHAFLIALSLIIIGLLWGRFKAMHVFAAPVLLLILLGFMGIKHIYAAAVNPSILNVMALIALTGILKKHSPSTESSTYLGTQADQSLSKAPSSRQL